MSSPSRSKRSSSVISKTTMWKGGPQEQVGRKEMGEVVEVKVEVKVIVKMKRL